MSTQQHLQDLLAQGCQNLGLSLSAQQSEQLVAYTTELDKWNKTYNLTAVRDIEDMMKRHVIDALSVVQHVQNYQPKQLADIGTGGGIPGVILAILLPELHVYLVESIGKKCRFLRHVSQHLGLSERIHVVQSRVEAWTPPEPLDIVICRAFTSLLNFTTITEHLGSEQTVWLAMKSAHTAEEEQTLHQAFTLTENHSLNVPFEVAARHLIVLRKTI